MVRLYERDQVDLPPKNLRAAGIHFAEDKDFLDFAAKDVSLIRRYSTLSCSRILDFGCGCGRLYFGLELRDEPILYVGVDILAKQIDWAMSNISAANSRIRFHHQDILNERYNPTGKKEIGEWMEVLDDCYDIIYAYSVFSHLDIRDAQAVLEMFKVTLSKNGIAYISAFTSPNSPDIELNPMNTKVKIDGPLHVVMYNERIWNSIVERSGLSVIAHYTNSATDGQSIYVIGHN